MLVVPPAEQPRRLKHYEIIAPLGEGGMGVVYRARDTRLGRDVALKLLPDKLATDEERSLRFQREAQIVSGLSHPGIAHLYDFDRDGDVAFLAMELVEGPTLRERLAGGPLGIDLVLGCAAQVAEALAAAHRSGVVHRDLKPENIMATESGYYKVLDFGIARIEDLPGTDPTGTQTPTRTWATKAGTIIGTVAYMSPEQVLGKPADARSDVFSLGSVIWELATGRPAFRGDSEIATAHAIAYDDPPSMRSLRPEIPEGLELAVLKCLSKNPAERYGSAGELAQDLELLRAEQISGSRTSRVLIARKPRRRKLWVAAACVGALVLLGWAAVGLRRSPSGPVSATVPTALPLIGQEAGAPVEGPKRVIVAFFENNSGDPEADWLSQGLPEMLTTDLARSEHLDVIATQRLRDLLVMSGNEEKIQLDRSTSAELARWVGADVVISGSVFKTGESYRIDAQAYDTESGRVLVARKVEGTELFPMVDELTAGLKSGFRIDADEERGLQAVTTSSEQAFRRFVRGKELYDNLMFAEASEAFESSLGADPGFALARLHLALSHLAVGDIETGVAALNQAIGQEAGLPGSDRLFALALGAYYVDGDFEAGSAGLDDLIRRFPGHKYAYVAWARAIEELEGRPLRASRKLRAAIEQDPNNLPAIAALSRQLADMGAIEDARGLLERTAGHHPDARAALDRLISSL